MTAVEPGGERFQQHFTEGEPDLQPLEELAVEELDDDLVLEADLDFDRIGEDDVEDRLIAETLEALVHAGDEAEDGVEVPGDEFRCRNCGQVRHRTELVDARDRICRACSR